ncbi:MAG: hypothetical protein FWH04_10205 [Oscillospiraceae bacterium]|nr:hypothetical protein [Oscillospiraceae bacterium]
MRNDNFLESKLNEQPDEKFIPGNSFELPENYRVNSGSLIGKMFSDKNSIASIVLTMTLITALIAALLSVVYVNTRDRIEENNRTDSQNIEETLYLEHRSEENYEE